MYLRSGGGSSKKESEFYALDDYNKRQKLSPPPPPKCWDEDEDDDRGNKEPEEIVMSKRLLKEAKKAAPVLLAKPGDKFEWCSVDSSWAEPCVMKYVGRNTLRPTSKHSPEAGWLVFKNEYSSENNIDILKGIRDEIGAWPYDKYSHYSYKTLKEATTMFELALWKANIDQADDTADRESCRVEVPGPLKDTLFGFFEGKRKVGTLCIPPSKCGPIKVYKEPSYW